MAQEEQIGGDPFLPFGADNQTRLIHLETREFLMALGVLLQEYVKVHGDFPPSLRELEQVAGRDMDRRWCVWPAYPRIVDDAVEEYRYVYRPESTESILVAIPRDPTDELQILALWWFTPKATSPGMVRAGKLLPDGNFVGEQDVPNLRESLRLFSLSRRESQAAQEAIVALRWVVHAQLSHEHLFGRFAARMSDLTDPPPPAKFLLLPGVFREGRIRPPSPVHETGPDAGYRIETGIDGRGWWARAEPWPGAESCLYRYRVGQDRPMEFSIIISEWWRPLRWPN